MNPNILMVAFAPLVAAWWISWGLILIPLIQRVLVLLGIGFVVFTGYTILFDQLEGYVMGSFVGLPANMTALLSIARVDDGAAMVMSAISVRLILMAVTAFGGRKKTMRLKA